MKSIMQAEKECYECKKAFGISKRSNLEEHHIIFGSGRRGLSEKYGLKVYLCYFHHRGKGGVHFFKDLDDELKAEAQTAFEQRFPELNFLQIFGRNYN